MSAIETVRDQHTESGRSALAGHLRDIQRAKGRSQLPPRALDILGAADQVLLQGGMGELSLRRVASRAGFSLATVQHYFPLKANLVREMMEVRLDWYHEQLSDLVGDLSDDPGEAFDSVMSWFLDDNLQVGASGWWFHFWALASHDVTAREILDRAMLLYRQTLAVVVSGLNPKLSKTEALTRAAVITCAFEGSLLLLADDKQRHGEVERLPSALRRYAKLVALD